MSTRRFSRCLLIWLGAAALIRVGWISVRKTELQEDRDAYLALAENLAQGQGYSSPDGTRPTAYRPPLYPMVLALGVGKQTALWVALVNLLSAIITGGLLYPLARRLALPEKTACLAVLLLAVDPLLIRYVSLPMTETLCALLITALLVGLAAPGVGLWKAAGLGLLFGLTALCRPTVWPFALLYLLWRLATRKFQRPDLVDARTSGEVPRLIAAALGMGLVIVPWGVRNAWQLGTPIINTTHGGYTLLLGNNPAFYQEVVQQEYGTVWDGSHGAGQAAWLKSVQTEMQQAGIESEPDQDRWMFRRALSNIAARPGLFLQACWLRFRRFWGLVPLVEGGQLSLAWKIAIQLFYALLFLSMIWGAIVLMRQRRVEAVPLGLMLAAFQIVHLFFWTNTRMRAPVTPVIVLFAAVGLADLIGRIRRPTHD